MRRWIQYLLLCMVCMVPGVYAQADWHTHPGLEQESSPVLPVPHTLQNGPGPGVSRRADFSKEICRFQDATLGLFLASLADLTLVGGLLPFSQDAPLVSTLHAIFQVTSMVPSSICFRGMSPMVNPESAFDFMGVMMTGLHLVDQCLAVGTWLETKHPVATVGLLMGVVSRATSFMDLRFTWKSFFSSQ